MARIQGVSENKAGLLARLAFWGARRQVGKVPEPLTVAAHSGAILAGMGAFEMALQRARRVDLRVTALAGLKAAMMIGCPF